MASSRTIKRREAAKEMLGMETKAIKPKRKRKPLTEEQKQVLRERMEKARKARGPSKNLSLHESIRDLPDDHPLSPKKVKGWLKEQKELLSGLGKQAGQDKDPKIRQLYWDTETYIFNLNKYLQDGLWLDHRYGSAKQNKIKMNCVKMAYYSDGTPKRTIGVYYPDIGAVYTQEMELDKYADGSREKVSNKKRVRKTNRANRKRS